MPTRKRQLERMAATLTEWAAQIADLRQKGRTAGAEAQVRIAGQLATLRAKWAEYQDQMLEMRDTSEAVFRDMQKRADALDAGFREAYVRTTTRFPL